jgi:hypothetical protein
MQITKKDFTKLVRAVKAYEKAPTGPGSGDALAEAEIPVIGTAAWLVNKYEGAASRPKRKAPQPTAPAYNA